MGILTDRKNREIQANSSAIAPSNYIVSLGLGDDAKDYEVIDGDTIKLAGVANAPGLRIGRRKSPEILHYSGKDRDGNTQAGLGETGGEHEKDVLFSILSEGNFNTVIDKGKQTYGRGAGQRHIVELKDSNTGQDLNEYLLGAGLVNTNDLSTQLEVDAYNAGVLRRKLSDEDKYGELRAERDYNPRGFKKTALNSQWYAESHGSDVYSGVAFRKDNETLEGYTTTPLATAFSTGYFSLLADLGGSLNAVGVLTGNEWLTEKGQFAAFVNNHRADNNPFQEISRLADIGKDQNGFISATGDAFQWLGVNAVQSAPFLLALAGATVATGGAAGVAGLSASVATKAALAVSTGTSAAFHAGEIWNNLDADKRTGKNAGTALALGTFAGALDSLAFGRLIGINKVFTPSQLMNDTGRKKIVDYIAKKQGVTEPEAWKILGKSVDTQTKAFLKDSFETTKGLISKQRVIQSAILATLPAMGIEASTEVLQELTTYTTAQAINEGVSGIDDIHEFITEELMGDDPELRDILLNAGAAGGLIGGGFSAVSSTRQIANTSRLFAELDQSSSAELSEIPKVYYDKANEDDNIATTQAGYATRNQGGAGETAAFDGGTTDGLADRLIESAENSTAAQRVIEGKSTLIGEAGNQLKKLYKEELLRVLSVKSLRASQALRNLYSYVSGTRATHGGQAYEKKIASDLGTLKHITNARLIGKEHNFDFKSERAIRRFSDKLYRFGKLTQDKDPSALTDKDLESIGITRDEVAAYTNTSEKFQRRADLQLKSRKDALERVYGKDDVRVTDASQNLKGWWWKHRDFEKAKIVGNSKEFQRIVADTVRGLDKTKMSKADKDLYGNPEEFAALLTETLISGRPASDVMGEYTLISAGSKSPHERTLDLSNQPGMEAFLDENIFRTLHTADQASVRNTTRLEYFGHQGQNLDLMMNDAAQELKASGFGDSEIFDMLGQAALATKGIVDASESNYNPIKNDTLRKMQDYALLYTGVIGMSLSAPASIPEYIAILVGVRNHPGFNAYAQNVGKELLAGLHKTMANVKAKATGGARLGTEFEDMLERVGVPNDSGYFQRKFGAGDELAVGARIQAANQAFYWIIGLQGITETQRTLAASTAVDMIRDESAILLEAGDRLGRKAIFSKEKHGKKPILLREAVPRGTLNSNEIQAFSKLQELGIDVMPFIERLRTAGGATTIEKTLTDVHADLLPDIETGILAFVDSRIQNPGAANRPLLLQDPHYRMLTQFNGFISAVTTTLVPKIWNDNLGRGLRTRHPSLSIDTFGVVLTMILLGGLGQALKDEAKFGETTTYLEGYDKFIQRALTSSGILGQGEKVLEIVKPLYESENIGERVLGTFTGSAGRSAQSVGDLFVPHEYEGVSKSAETWNDILKFVPGFSNFTGGRQATVDWITK